VYFVVVADLHRRTDYLVRVQALTVNGSGPATQWIPVQTFANDLDGMSISVSLVLTFFIKISKVARCHRPAEAQCTRGLGLGYKLCAVTPVAG